MNILVMSQYFYPENFRVNDLCVELVNRGHSVTVLTGYPQYPQGKIYDGYGFSKEYERNWHGVSIERVKMKPRGRTPLGLLDNCYSYVREANKWVKRCKIRYDIVYVFEVSPVTVGLPAVTYKKKFGTPIAFNVQDLWPENVECVLGIHFKPIIRAIDYIVDKIYNNSDYILCSSQSFVKNIITRGIDKNKLYFWPQFCDVPKFDNSKKPKCYKDENFNIVFAGNIGEAQGLDLLVDTAENMKESNVKWYLVGDGRARTRLEEKVKEKGLEEKVIFIGRVSTEDADRYVYFADCAYLSFADNPLFDMTIPAKLQTYLACGTPILAAAGGESADIINKAQCGIAVERNKVKVLNAVKELINAGNSMREEMGKNAREYFMDNYEKSKVTNRLEEIIFGKVKDDKCVEVNYV